MISYLIQKMKWWLNKENKHCQSCCLFCRYYYRCVYDVTREKELE